MKQVLRACRPRIFISILTVIFILSGCGASKNPRLRKLGSGFRGFNGQSNQTFQLLKSDVKFLSVSDINQPVQGEEIEYKVEFTQKRRLQFREEAFKCIFDYNKANLKETIIKHDNILKIESRILALEAKYVGLPILAQQQKCQASVNTYRINPSLRIIKLGKNLSDFKHLIDGQIFSVVEKCKSRGQLKDGKCIQLDMELSREIESIFEDIVVYKIRSKVRFANQTKEFYTIINLTRPYFAYFGIISQQGGMPLAGISAEKEIKSLELLRWVKP
jgi:hypothetical protein